VKVGCCAYSYRQLLTGGEMSLEAFIEQAYAIGLDGVELTAYYFHDTTKPFLHHIKRLALAKGVEISGTAIGGAFCQDDGPRAEHVAMAKQWVDVTASLGAPWMRVFAGQPPEGAEPQQAFDWAVDGLAEIAAYAGEQGITIGLENHHGLTATFQGLKALLDAVDSPWLAANLDLGNYTHGDDPYGEIAATAPLAINVHAKTTMGDGQALDYPRIINILRDVGYQGYLSLEYEDAQDPVIAVPRFTTYIRSLTRW